MITTTHAERAAQGRKAALVKAAKNAGVSLEEYLRRRDGGEKFCTPHGQWHPWSAFGKDAKRADGLASGCKVAANEVNRRHYERSGRNRPSGHPTPGRAPQAGDVAPPEPPRRARRRPLTLAEVRSEPPPPDPAPGAVPAVAVDSSWRHRAACRSEDPDLFQPVGSGDAALAQTRAAQRVCQACPVRAFCLEEALARAEVGIWGGLSEDDRRQLRARGAVA